MQHTYVEQRGDGYFVPGTRVSLDSIVYAFQAGDSPDEILKSFPAAGSLARIYGAILFYLENTDEVDAYLKRQDGRWEALRRQCPKSSDSVSDRLRDAKDHATATRL